MDSLVRVGQVAVETYAGQGRLKRIQAQAIGRQGSHGEVTIESIPIMGADGDDVGNQRFLGNYRWLVTTIDRLERGRSGWVPPFDSPSTAHGGILIHVKR